MPNDAGSGNSSEHGATATPPGSPPSRVAASPPPGRLAALLVHRRLPIFLALLAAVLASPSLWGGWVGDDTHHRLRLVGSKELPELSGDPFKLYVFADGNPEHTERLMDIGIWPWWTMPRLKVAFMRPISVITHWLDYQLWPSSPAMMHLQNLIWFAALAIVVAYLYRRMHGLTLVASLAALLYVIDDARGMPVGFIANRNAVIATVFGVLTIIAHDRWRRGADVRYAVLAPLLLLASLLSAEAGIGTIAYLFAHAVFLDRGSLLRRAAVLMPYALIVVGWRVAWTLLDYGVYGIGLYVDPISEPIRFAVAVMNRVPVLLLAQLFFPPSESYLAAMGFGYRYYYVVGAAVIVIALAVVMARRLRWDAMTRFWALGMLLSILPICTAFPSDRMLFFVGLGAFALIARFLSGGRTDDVPAPRGRGRAIAETTDDHRYTARAEARGSGTLHMVDRNARIAAVPGTVGWITRALVVALIVVHVGIAPLLLAVRAYMPLGPRSLIEASIIPLPHDASVSEKTIVAVCAPAPFAAGYLPEQRALAGLPIPAHTRVLAPNDSDFVRVRRIDANTLSVRPAKGYLRIPTDRLPRSRHHPMHAGQRVEIAGLTVEVVSLTDDGRPLEAVFRFDKPLDDPSFVWLHWQDDEFAPFTPPPVGTSVDLKPGAPFL